MEVLDCANELLVRIAGYFAYYPYDCVTLGRLSRTCRQFRAACYDILARLHVEAIGAATKISRFFRTHPPYFSDHNAGLIRLRGSAFWRPDRSREEREGRRTITRLGNWVPESAALVNFFLARRFVHVTQTVEVDLPLRWVRVHHGHGDVLTSFRVIPRVSEPGDGAPRAYTVRVVANGLIILSKTFRWSEATVHPLGIGVPMCALPYTLVFLEVSCLCTIDLYFADLGADLRSFMQTNRHMRWGGVADVSRRRGLRLIL